MIRVKYLFAIVLLGGLLSCSRTTLNMRSNTWAARTYHNVTSKYNIYFNGNEAYKDGLAKVKDQNQDDYSRVLPVFLDSQHEHYKGAKSDMEYAIEKANKIIQLHSIKIKPDFNARKASDPDYRAWRNQEEFNKMVDDAYLLIGKANFYQEEFLAAIGTFNYVALKYTGQEAWYEAHLWIARAYLEMGWLYEAENMLTLINDDNLPYSLIKSFNLISADLQIKRENYKEAIPFLRSALESRLPKATKQRLHFILAQIYQMQDERVLAYDNYKAVVRSIPSYEMEFNARIRMSEVLVEDDDRRAIKKLERMLKDPKNLEYKGQIYYALGNIYTQQDNRMLAIENYRLSLAFSDGLQQGITAKTIGELYYAREDYLKASTYYAQALANLPEDYPSYYAVNYRAGVLERLSTLYAAIGDNDRAYRLAQMSADEKQAFLDKEAQEAMQEERIQSLIAEVSGENSKELEIKKEQAVVAGDWYFFNPNLVEQGKSEFRNQWGQRQLRDNWRRSMANSFEEESYDDFDQEVAAGDLDEGAYSQEGTLAPELADTVPEEVEVVHKISDADMTIIDAYFNLGSLYLFDIENRSKAIETLAALEQQFPFNPHSADSYFAIYTAAQELGNDEKAVQAKDYIITHFPESRYALILSNPEAKRILDEDRQAYNDLYEHTFDLFLRGQNADVVANAVRLKTDFRDTSLTPKVLLMEALAVAKMEPQADIRPTLELLIADYSYDEDVKAQAQLILNQMNDGKTVALGGSAANTLSKRRNAEAQLERERLLQTQHYTNDPDARHYFVLILPDSLNINKNQLQFEVARFNFNKFLTMDFELSQGKLNAENSLFIVNGFAGVKEGIWYRNQFLASEVLDKFPEIRKWYVISEENFRLLLLLRTLEEYDAFEQTY